MLLMKIAGCFMILCSTSGMGFLYAGELRRRQEDLKAIRQIALLLRGEIRYAHTPLPEAFANTAGRHESRLTAFLDALADGLSARSRNTFAEIWGQAEEKLACTSFNKKDKELLHHFGENLGQLDKEMQLNTIDLFLDQTEMLLNELSDEMASRMRLYRSIGIMAGIFVIILVY